MSKKDTDTRQGAVGVRIEPGHDVICCTVGLYETFMSQVAIGMQALGLYFHLMYTACRQDTNQVWAADKYLCAGISVGKVKIKTLKAMLSKMGLISYVQEKGKTDTSRKDTSR